VDATLDLVGRNGLSAVTMAEVARAAGMTRKTLYTYFRDVGSIFVAQRCALYRTEELTLCDGLQAHLGPECYLQNPYEAESQRYGANDESPMAALTMVVT
jgi:AcrR family transcriptional regulator